MDTASAAAGDQAADQADALVQLGEALEQADDLPLDARLQLLQRTEAEIARALEGLDGL